MAASNMFSIASMVFLAFLRFQYTITAAARKHSSMAAIPISFIFLYPAIPDSINSLDIFLCAKFISQTLNRD